MTIENMPPIPSQPLDPSKPASVALWKKQFFDPLARILKAVGSLSWSSLDKSKSSLADIAKRDHSLLTNVKGGDQHATVEQQRAWNEHVGSAGANHHGLDHDATYARLGGSDAQPFTAETLATAGIGLSEPALWKLGTVVADGALVDTTRYVEVEIDGVVVKLAVVV